MDKEMVETIRGAFKWGHRGYEIHYYPKYKDFICTSKELVGKFLFIPIYKNKINYILKKDEIPWENISIPLTFRNCFTTYEMREYFDAYIDEERKLILYK